MRVPDGFATTADAYRRFIGDTGLAERISRAAGRPGHRRRRARWPRSGRRSARRSSSSRSPTDLEADIRAAYDQLVGERRRGARSPCGRSATAEDLPDASFAGQQETFLNVRGIDAVLQAIREVFASLYNDRAIAYRVHHGFDHDAVALSAGVQRMVRSDVGASGVMFTMDTESGFDDAVFITSSYGLGEAVVQGAVNPDEFYVYKPALRAGRPGDPQARRRRQGDQDGLHRRRRRSAGPPSSSTSTRPSGALLSLTDDEVEELARHALTIEEHYGRPMDIEWGKDGVDGAALHPAGPPGDGAVAPVRRRRCSGTGSTSTGRVLVEGRAIGQKIGAGAVRVLDLRRRRCTTSAPARCWSPT